MLQIFDWVISCEESVLNKGEEVQKWPESDCSAVTGSLGVIARPETEVEAQLGQVGNMLVFGFGCGGRCCHDGVDNYKGVSLFSFDQRVLDAVGFKLTDEVSVQSSV